MKNIFVVPVKLNLKTSLNTLSGSFYLWLILIGLIIWDYSSLRKTWGFILLIGTLHILAILVIIEYLIEDAFKQLEVDFNERKIRYQRHPINKEYAFAEIDSVVRWSSIRKLERIWAENPLDVLFFYEIKLISGESLYMTSLSSANLHELINIKKSEKGIYIPSILLYKLFCK